MRTPLILALTLAMPACSWCWPRGGSPAICAVDDDDASPDDDDATADDDDASPDDDDATADDDDATADDDDATLPEPDADGMLTIDGGPFTLGCDDGTPGCDPESQPAVQVSVDPFRIDAFEVTNAAYAEFLTDHGNDCEGAQCFSYLVNGEIDDQGDGTWLAEPATANHPVHDVDWLGASTYCAWRGHQLPTEAQWERAARGEDGRRYPWGDEDPDCVLAIFDEGGSGCGTNDAWDVGTRPDGRSPFGAWDLAGNLWEWTADWQADDWSDIDPDNPTGPVFGTTKVVRGGGFASNAVALTTWSRWGRDPDHGSGWVGFRCAAGP